MKQGIYTIAACMSVFFMACKGNDKKFDASGTFETDEVIVSSELTGKLLSFTVQEGQTIPRDSVVGIIDAENLSLQKEQVEASINALSEKTSDVTPQIKLEAVNPCIVMIKTNAAGNTIEEIAVTDPTEKLETVQLKVNIPLQYTGKNGNTTWDKGQKATTIQVVLPKGGYAGSTAVLNILPTSSE